MKTMYKARLHVPFEIAITDEDTPPTPNARVATFSSIDEAKNWMIHRYHESMDSLNERIEKAEAKAAKNEQKARELRRNIAYQRKKIEEVKAIAEATE